MDTAQVGQRGGHCLGHFHVQISREQGAGEGDNRILRQGAAHGVRSREGGDNGP